ncbi:MAG: BMP family protein [Ilumatobacter sp.]|uniref:BMP family protein n=1 Tax=Ilumatobacter sp. TaxID=1967498 RepID=UPI002637A5C9|nr:BMP family protein [Ilumatobacter sp.]MDJ0770846.1 BMP family protein [Ilumatobacter sp.]
MSNQTRSRGSLRLGAALLATVALIAASCGDDDDDADDAPAEAAEESADDGATDDGATDDGATDDAATDDAATDDAATDDGATDDAATDDAAADAGFRVAIVAPSASNDLAFTQSIVDSIERVAESRPIETSITDGTFIVEDAAAALRGYAEDGFDLVIAHGSQYGAPLQEIAPDFPDVSFAWGTAADTFGIPNVYAYTVRADEGGYVNGTIAAQLTESNTLGVVGPIEVGDAKLYVDGFVAGVAAQNPDATVNVNYIESFSDVALASEAANAHVSNGADVLTGTAQMVVGATGVAGEAGIPWFGTQSNQTDLGPGIVVASQVYHWEVLFDEIIDNIQAGTLGGEVFIATLANGGLEMEFNAGYGLDPDIQSAAEDTVTAIASGDLSTGIE